MAVVVPRTTLQAAVKAAIVDTLAAFEGLDGIQISYGHPGKSIKPRALCVMDIYGETTNTTIGRPRHRDELFNVAIIADVLKKGTDQRGATEGAYELVQQTELAIDADHTLGGIPGLVWATVTGPFTLTEQFDADGRQASIEFFVECKTRI